LERLYQIDVGNIGLLCCQIEKIPFDVANQWESSSHNTLLIETTPNITKACRYQGIEEALIKLLENIGGKQVELKTTIFRIWEPQQFLVEIYIQYFGNSTCFAYTDIATPTLDRHAQFFTEADLVTLLGLIEKNSQHRSRINQILGSGNGDAIYTILYQRCQYSEVWKYYLSTSIGLEEAHRRNYLHNILKSEDLYSVDFDPYSKLGS